MSSGSQTADGKEQQPLGGLTVLDLTDDIGALTCRILGGFGASCVRIVVGESDPLKNKAPTVRTRDGEPFSLYYAHMVGDRPSEKIDLMEDEGRTRFRELLAGADVLVESRPVGWFQGLDLGFDRMLAEYPRLVWTSITPFGSTGPRSGWQATDLIGMAAGGLMSLCGDPDRPPLRSTVEQGYAQAGIAGAVGTLAAVHARQRFGRGQHVDVSMQEAVSNCLGNARLYFELERIVSRRAGGGRAYGEHGTRLVYGCADGYVSISRTPSTIGLVHSWLTAHGADPGFDPEEWAALPQSGPTAPGPEKSREIDTALERFFSTRGKMDLYEQGQELGILICPVANPADLLANTQLQERHFFVSKHLRELNIDATVPGAPVRFSRSAWVDVEPQNSTSKETHVEPVDRVAMDAHQILAGIRVADFSWVGVGPLATQMLAQLGAEVIRVESSKRLDTLRSAGPRRGEGPDAGSYFANFNRDKHGITLNLRAPQAREVALRLAAASDVLVESFTPGFMESIGLSYADIRKANPNIIMMSCSMEGATGPHKNFKGFGLTTQAAAGFTHFTGWPDRPPVGMGTAYTDWFASGVAAASLLAALEERRRSGLGQFLDLSQVETCIWALDAEVLRFTVTGEFGSANGNRHPEMVPHGVFPCKGNDEWIAIGVRDDREWRALAEHVDGLRGWRAMDHQERKTVELEIEDAVARWTAQGNSTELSNDLQNLGIPAYPVNDMEGVHNDVQLRAREHFWRGRHPVIGDVDWDGPAFRLSETPMHFSRPAPLLGQDNDRVYSQILGYESHEVAQLVVDGVLD